MKIAMLTNNYKPFIGDVPISVERLSEGLRRLGHQVVIFAPEADGCKDECDVVRYQTLCQRRECGMVIGNCFDRRIEQRFREERFDVIHVHHPVVIGFTAVYLSKKYGIPLAYTYHTRYEAYLHYFKVYEMLASGREPAREAARIGRDVIVPKYLSAFANQCDLVFAPTVTMQNYLAGQGIDTAIAVLPTGIGREAFQCDVKRRQEIRSKYLKGRKWLFATTARLEREKNLEFLLRGAARLKELAGDCFRLMVIGDGTLRAGLERLVKELGIEEQIVFTGRIPNREVAGYLHASDGFLFASKSETQGIVLLEAMAAGCPVTAVKASVVVDVVRHGKNGFMTEENEEEWAAAVFRMMDNPSLYRSLSAGAKETASMYREEKVAVEAEHQYRKMMERRAYFNETYAQDRAVPALLRLFKTA